jgi:glucose-6-phosphate dehydrogenase assembly protein OpcA
MEGAVIQLEPAKVKQNIPVGRIEEELAKILLGHPEPGETVTVRRARMSNLVIFCNEPERIAEVEQAIPNIVAVHPARVILAIHERSEEEGTVTGEVHAWRSVLGAKQEICSEQVTLHSHGRSGEHLIFAVRGIKTGDLPTNLWWACTTPPALAGPVMNEAAEHVQQIIYDSNGWMDPARGVAATAAWIASMERGHESAEAWRVVSDINWRRLKFWRRSLAQALDPNAMPGALESITEIQVEHGPHAVVQAWLLVSWLTSRLGWQVGKGRVQPGVELSWQVQAPHGLVLVRIDRLHDGPTEVRRLKIRCALEGKPIVLRVSGETENRLTVLLEGVDAAPRTVTVQPQPLDELIARQLSDRERDPVFRDAMAAAERFARSVLR